MFDFKRKVNLSPERYTERIQLYKYSITFAGAAVAFLITAREKLNVSIDGRSLKILLASWGVAIFTGFAVYVLSYREVWYYRLLPDEDRNKTSEKIELFLIYAMMYLHVISMLFSVAFTTVSLWNSIR
jgi:ABC-type transport system involved in cytochrome c biogenesis permease subunit